MSMKSRITRLEKKAKGLNKEGMKFVYTKDTLQALYKRIISVRVPLVNDPDRQFSEDKGDDAGQGKNDVPNEER